MMWERKLLPGGQAGEWVIAKELLRSISDAVRSGRNPRQSERSLTLSSRFNRGADAVLGTRSLGPRLIQFKGVQPCKESSLRLLACAVPTTSLSCALRLLAEVFLVCIACWEGEVQSVEK